MRDKNKARNFKVEVNSYVEMESDRYGIDTVVTAPHVFIGG